MKNLAHIYHRKMESFFSDFQLWPLLVLQPLELQGYIVYHLKFPNDIGFSVRKECDSSFKVFYALCNFLISVLAVDNSLVQVLQEAPLVPPNLLEEDEQCPHCQRFFPNLECVQNHILEKHSEYCKFCRRAIPGDFEEHLFNSHYKEKLYDVIPSSTRGCTGKRKRLQV